MRGVLPVIRGNAGNVVVMEHVRFGSRLKHVIRTRNVHNNA